MRWNLGVILKLLLPHGDTACQTLSQWPAVDVKLTAVVSLDNLSSSLRSLLIGTIPSVENSTNENSPEWDTAAIKGKHGF